MRTAPRFLIPLALGYAVACLVFGIATTSSAGSYIRLKPKVLKEAHALVFLGTVEAVRDSTFQPTKLRLGWVRMNSIWKGVPRRDRLRVTERVDPYGPPKLAAGETFVFYADSTAAGWVVDFTALRSISEASEDLAALGKPTIVQRVPGRKIRGSR
jgi:hypothetical protein